MKRRTLLASLGVGGATLAGVGAMKVTSKPRPKYLKNERVVYERDDLYLEVLQDTNISKFYKTPSNLVMK